MPQARMKATGKGDTKDKAIVDAKLELRRSAVKSRAEIGRMTIVDTKRRGNEWTAEAVAPVIQHRRRRR